MAEQSNLRLGVVTTWRSSCGIATYSEELYTELAEVGVPVVILSNFDPGANMRPQEEGPRTVHPCWVARSNSQNQNPQHILAAVQQHQINVVHIQHEFGLWSSNPAFYETLRLLRKAGVKVVVTPHTLKPFGGWETTGWVRRTAELAHAIVVHTLAQRAVFAPVVDSRCPVYQISHGTGAARVLSPDRRDDLAQEARERYSLPSGRIYCVVFGFVGSGKNLTCTIRGWAQAQAIQPALMADCRLLLIGEVQDERHVLQMSGDTSLSGLGNIYFRQGFVPVKETCKLMALADFGLLNTISDNLSASGQVHLYARYGVPLVVANRPIYNDAVRAGALPFELRANAPEQPDPSLINGILAMAANSKLRATVGKNLALLATRTAWSRLAPRYQKLYHHLLEDEASA